PCPRPERLPFSAPDKGCERVHVAAGGPYTAADDAGAGIKKALRRRRPGIRLLERGAGAPRGRRGRDADRHPGHRCTDALEGGEAAAGARPRERADPAPRLDRGKRDVLDGLTFGGEAAVINVEQRPGGELGRAGADDRGAKGDLGELALGGRGGEATGQDQLA